VRLELLILFLLVSVTLNASIGKISALVGDVVVLRDDANIKAKFGMALYEKDTINSGDNSKVQVIFNDDTIVTIGSRSAFKIKDYFYNEDQKKDSKVSFDFFKGKYKIVTGIIGDINKKAFKIKTQTASIDIEGTTIVGNQNIVACLDGTILVASLGKTIVLNKNQYTQTPPTSLPTKSKKLTSEILHPLKIYIESKHDPIRKRKLDDFKTYWWGGVSKIDISKNEVNNIIKQYLKKNKPDIVKSYEESLSKIKISKIDQYSDEIFVNDGLMWQDNKAILTKEFNILESKIYCRKLTLANRKDWRVPSYEELFSLVNYNNINPSSINKIKYIQALKYWSITPFISDKNKYWYIDFNYGETFYGDKALKNKIRCVRDISKKADDY